MPEHDAHGGDLAGTPGVTSDHGLVIEATSDSAEKIMTGYSTQRNREPAADLQPREVTREIAMSTVLVVDDEFGIAELVVDILTDKGHRVVTAANGRQGLEALARERPSLVFLDYMMPFCWTVRAWCVV